MEPKRLTIEELQGHLEEVGCDEKSDLAINYLTIILSEIPSEESKNDLYNLIPVFDNIEFDCMEEIGWLDYIVEDAPKEYFDVVLEFFNTEEPQRADAISYEMIRNSYRYGNQRLRQVISWIGEYYAEKETIEIYMIYMDLDYFSQEDKEILMAMFEVYKLSPGDFLGEAPNEEARDWLLMLGSDV